MRPAQLSCDPSRQRQRGCTGCELEELPTGTFHCTASTRPDVPPTNRRDRSMPSHEKFRLPKLLAKDAKLREGTSMGHRQLAIHPKGKTQ
jgi:hypothetical protein